MPYANPKDPRARESRKRHYRNNKEQYARARDARKEQLKSVLRERKSQPCTDCGQSYPYYVMQFDHVRGEKKYEPAKLPSTGSLRILEEELAKCELVCANCHAERTHQRRQ